MSGRLLFFNCSTDMALASGLDHYTPPPMIQVMERELELLPLWWAEEGDVVWVSDIAGARRFLRDLNEQFVASGLPPKHVGFADVKGRLVDTELGWDALRPCPWGWNRSIARQLLKLGINPCFLPSSERLEHIRSLSSRRTAVGYLHRLLEHFRTVRDSCLEQANALLGADMRFEEDYAGCVAAVRTLLSVGPVMLKSPWSSSGKGNYVVRAEDENVLRWVKSVVAKQGGLCIDRFHQKVLDFAMEFHLEAGSCRFLGYSLFDTDGQGRYEGNRVASQERILEDIVSFGAERTLLEQLVEYHISHLPLLLGGDYEGVVGIDMLLARSGSAIVLHPCIEINMRRNMGVVAMSLAHQSVPVSYLTPSSHPHFRARLLGGRFFIERCMG